MKEQEATVISLRRIQWVQIFSWAVLRCGGPHFARECPEGGGGGSKGKAEGLRGWVPTIGF